MDRHSAPDNVGVRGDMFIPYIQEGIPTTHILDTWECTLTESKSLKN